VTKRALVILGKNINRLRVAAGITQEELAEKANLSRRYVQELEAGAKGPLIPTLVRIRLALKLSWEELMRGL
jgi:transcriptional regulator with XRE-family HTH domain